MSDNAMNQGSLVKFADVRQPGRKPPIDKRGVLGLKSYKVRYQTAKQRTSLDKFKSKNQISQPLTRAADSG